MKAVSVVYLVNNFNVLYKRQGVLRGISTSSGRFEGSDQWGGGQGGGFLPCLAHPGL